MFGINNNAPTVLAIMGLDLIKIVCSGDANDVVMTNAPWNTLNKDLLMYWWNLFNTQPVKATNDYNLKIFHTPKQESNLWLCGKRKCKTLKFTINTVIGIRNF